MWCTVSEDSPETGLSSEMVYSVTDLAGVTDTTDATRDTTDTTDTTDMTDLAGVTDMTDMTDMMGVTELYIIIFKITMGCTNIYVFSV